MKGPARGVAVEATALRPDGSEIPLGTAITAADGAFSLGIYEWRGPIVLRARGVVDGDTVSTYQDEARRRDLSWDVNQTLTAVVPEFDPAAPARPVLVTPLTDLAWARARGLAAQRGREALEAYAESLELLARHFGLSGADALLRVRPASAEQAVTPPPTENVRYLLALGCLSQRSLDLATGLDPAAPDAFTALDLVAALREDVQTDAWFDGRRGAEPIVVGHGGTAVALGDGLRADLATACARWLSRPGNPLGLSVAFVADDLERMSRASSLLFAADAATRSFDDGPPVVTVELEPDAGMRRELDGHNSEDVAGRVTLAVHATDLAGVSTIEVDAPGLEPGMTFVETPDDSSIGRASSAMWSATIDTRLVRDGRYAVDVSATDVLGNRASRRSSLTVDNTPPSLRIARPDGTVEHEGRWYTNAQRLRFPVDVDDASPELEVTAEVAGSRATLADGAVELELPGSDGLYPVTFIARDPLGNTNRVVIQAAVDRTPPTLEQISTSYADERALDTDRDLAMAERVSLSSTDPIPLRKWQTRWNAGDDNPVQLRWSVRDAESAGAGTSTALLALAWTWQLDGEPDTTVLTIGGGGTRTLELTADELQVDPVRAPPPRGSAASAEVHLRDLAGNEARLRSRFELDILPPPARLRVSLPRRPQPGLRDASLGAWLSLLHGARLVELELTNPHDVPIRMEGIRPPAELIDLALNTGLLAQATEAMIGRRVDHFGVPLELPDGITHVMLFIGHDGSPTSHATMDTCSLLNSELQSVYVHLIPWSPDIPPHVSLSYLNTLCSDLTPAPTGTWTLRAPLVVESPDADLRPDGTLYLPPHTTRTLRIVTTAPEIPPELAVLLAATEGPEGYEHVPYVRDLQDHLIYARPIDGELADRLCTTCFDDEPDCEVTCQPLDDYIGYRVQAITDVRIRAWENPEDEGRPWTIHTISADGTLSNETGAIPAPPTIRLRRDLDTWADRPAP